MPATAAGRVTPAPPVPHRSGCPGWRIIPAVSAAQSPASQSPGPGTPPVARCNLVASMTAAAAATGAPARASARPPPAT